MFIEDRLLDLEEYLNKLSKEGVFPGASYGLVGEDKVYSNFLGQARLLEGVEETRANTLYDLASLTKVISTTTAIMLLIERGYFTLDTPVKDLLPAYKNRGVRIKHLLTHTSGHDADIDCREMNRGELIEAIYDSKIEAGRFEREILYSDIGYILLGFIIEELTGCLEEFVEENIFQPLDMKETFFNPRGENVESCASTEYCKMRKRLIKGQVHDEKAYILGGIAGHAGLFSTAEDLTKFIQMYLQGGNYRGEQILNRQTIDLVGRIHTSQGDSRRGLGWIVKGQGNLICDLASSKTLYHTGFTGTSIIIDPEYKKGFVLLTNRVHPSRDNLKLIKLRRNIANIAFSAIR